MSQKILLPTTSFFLVATPALAQTAETSDNSLIPALMFATFGLVIGFTLIAYIGFLRKRSNREAANRTLNPHHPSNQ